MSAQVVVEQLAERHETHLRWLQARLKGRLAADEAEDVLQAAYARALTALSGPAETRPHFAHPDQATAWLRTIALNRAHDLARARRGRPGDGRAARPSDVGLDGAVGTRLVADVDVEAQVVEAAERESHRRLVLEAIARLDARHRQILQLRYGRDLPPAAIMVLMGLDRRQWDGRHTRALKAFGRALGRRPVSPECRETRLLLRTSPAVLLDAGRRSGGDHVDSCLPCAAFSRAARGAMAALPLPLAIEPWRLDAAQVLAPPAKSPATAVIGSGSATEGAAAAAGGAAAPVAASAAVVVTAAMALAGLTALNSESRPAGPAGIAETSRIAGAGASTKTRLAVHLTPRQTLERKAREAGRRRAAARRAASRALPSQPGRREGR